MALGTPGCISDVTIDPAEGEIHYVIEGEIDSGSFARVLVSKTQPFFSTFGTSDLAELVVDHAVVFLSDGDTMEQLQFVIDTFYTKIPLYRSFRIRGEVGKVYRLSVTIDSLEFVARDTLRAAIHPDAIRVVAAEDSDTLFGLHMTLTDPPEYGQCYCMSLKRVGRDADFQNAPLALFSDDLFNGEVWEAPLFAPNFNFLTERDTYFKKGEIVVVKTRIISRTVYDILFAAEYQSLMTFNPFQNGQPIPTNFSGEVLGLWGAYGISLDTVLIK